MKTNTFRVEEQRNNRNMTEFRWVQVEDFATLEEAKKSLKTTHPWRPVTETDAAYDRSKRVVATAVCAFTENEHRIVEIAKQFVIQMKSETSRGWSDVVRGFESRADADAHLAANRNELEADGSNELRIVEVES